MDGVIDFLVANGGADRAAAEAAGIVCGVLVTARPADTVRVLAASESAEVFGAGSIARHARFV